MSAFEALDRFWLQRELATDIRFQLLGADPSEVVTENAWNLGNVVDAFGAHFLREQ